MKKVTVLTLNVDRENTLEVLRELGVMHLKHVQVPAGETVDEARADHARIQRALEMLPEEHHAKPSGDDPEKTVAEITKILEKRKDLSARYDALAIEEKRIEPYTSFDPVMIRKLREKGVFVKLGKIIPREEPVFPENTALHIISETKDGQYVAVIGEDDFNMPVGELRLPEKSLADIQQEMAGIQSKLEAFDQEMHDLGGERPVVQKYLHEAEDQLSYVEARYGMGGDERISFLQGFCPDESMEKVRAAASDHGWGLLVDEPGPEDNVPTEIRNPAWVRPIKAIFDITGIMPGYDEVDVSPVFLIALSIFFAMLVGDAGYGALFFGMTFLARKKMKKAPQYPFSFMYIMSVCTMIWGVMTGTYFGMSRASLPIPYIQWFNNDANVMFLCFLIGAVHLSVAHLWNAWLLRNTPQAAAHVGWVLSTATMFFVACTFVLGHEMPRGILWVFIVGVVLIILFQTPLNKLKEEWINHAMLPLTVINNFSDVVSYLRLFAVGTASYAVASAFNQMLAVTSEDAIWVIPLKVVFLFLGHGLNIALCGLGILVHGVRLNTLEYSSHMGLQWKGHKYAPFMSKVKAAE
jgi:V/A-type H+-transporting ATPase subunit I